MKHKALPQIALRKKRAGGGDPPKGKAIRRPPLVGEAERVGFVQPRPKQKPFFFSSFIFLLDSLANPQKLVYIPPFFSPQELRAFRQADPKSARAGKL